MTESTTQQSEDPSAATMFTGVPQYELFAAVQHNMAVSEEMRPAESPFDFPDGCKVELPTTYEFNGQTRNLHALLGATHTSALLVVKKGDVRFEQYWLTGGRDVQWTSFSVAKSFVSALVGIAVAENFIASIEEPIDNYVAGLKGSGYEGVRIKDVLQMSSGAPWNEDYSDKNE